MKNFREKTWPWNSLCKLKKSPETLLLLVYYCSIVRHRAAYYNQILKQRIVALESSVLCGLDGEKSWTVYSGVLSNILVSEANSIPWLIQLSELQAFSSPFLISPALESCCIKLRIFQRRLWLCQRYKFFFLFRTVFTVCHLLLWFLATHTNKL